MAVVISNVLDAHDLAALREAADALEYEDGRTTAGRYARDVKSNLQAKKSPALDAIFETVRNTLDANEIV